MSQTISGENVTNSTELIFSRLEELEWVIEFKEIIELLPIPLCTTAVVSSLITYSIALNMESDQASVVTLKYVAIFVSVRSLDMIQTHAEPLNCE